MGKPSYFSTVAVKSGRALEVWHHIAAGEAAELAAILEMQSVFPSAAILLDPKAATLKGSRIRPELAVALTRITPTKH